MNFLRVLQMSFPVVAAILAGCEDGTVPEELRVPALPSVGAVADGSSVVLTAEFEDQGALAAAKEFGFYFGEDEGAMERMTVTKTDGLEYSLVKENLEYSTTYLYKAWVGNGRDEITSDLKKVVTDEEPVDPDPPSPVDPDPPSPEERNIEFKDPVVKALCVKNWDLNGDGELSESEAAKVTSLRQVFKRNEEITSFEELEYFTGLKSVADSAFWRCVNLRSVKLPESVIDIGGHAFEECGEVILPKLPDKLAGVGESAFCFCAKLSLTSLPETLTSIGNWAFSCCTNLALTTLPLGLTSIGDGTFNSCFNIVPEELPAGLTRLGSWAFSECSSFNPKSLPEGVETLGQNAFGGCSSLTWTRLPSSLREMGNWAFAQCWKVGFSSIPEGVVKVRKATFEGCFSMKSISLPESLQVIDSLAFNGLPLKEVTIPENVTFIGGDAFKGSERKITVKLLPKSPPAMEDTYLGDNADVIYVHAESLKKYRTSKNWNKWKDKYKALPGEEIPPDAIDIEFKDPVVKALCVKNWDLDGDGELSRAEAAKVTSLRQVFKRNEEITSFEELEYFTGLKSVADSAFKYCPKLSALTLPEGVRTIGEVCFDHCINLRIKSLPESLTSVGSNAFCYCSSLTLKELPENLTDIAWFAFDHCTSLVLTKLPSGMTRIEGGAFANCPNIAPERLPSGLTYIGPWAFFECTSFNPEALPESVTEIGNNAFQGCKSLSWAKLPESLMEVGEYAFYLCRKVKFTSLPENITKIHKAVFENCTGIEGITLPNHLNAIEANAFKNCKFYEISIPETVEFIGSEAFNGCNLLRKVTVLPVDPPRMEDTYLGDNADVIYVHAESLKKYRTSKNWNKWKDKYKALPGEEIPPDAIDIEFKDPVVKALCVKNWDLDGDGELSRAEAAKVTSLRQVFKRNEEITSFEELEYFTGLKSVADSAFKRCVNLAEIRLPESVTMIGQRAFEECGNMLLSKLPDNLTSVKTHAFVGCSKMPLTSLPETITEIENWAFSRCGSIKLSALPSKLTTIEGGVFSFCPGVAPSELPANLHYVGDWAFMSDVDFNPKSLPSGVKVIGKYAFQGCESLAWTSLPDGLLEIGQGAFMFCFKLKLTKLPPQIYCLHESVFENCWSIDGLTLPDNLDKIETRALANGRFYEITIPANVHYIGTMAFSGCDRLRQVTVLPETPPDMEDTFLGDNANVIFVPSASLEKYKSAKNWSEWKDKYKVLAE